MAKLLFHHSCYRLPTTTQVMLAEKCHTEMGCHSSVKVDTTYWSTPQSVNLFAATPSQSAGAWSMKRIATRHDVGSFVQPRILICTEQPTSRRVVVVNVFTSHIQFCIANRKARFACIVGKCDREIIHLPLLSNKIDS